MPIRQDADGRWHAEACVARRRLHRRLPAGATARDAKLIEAELVKALHSTGAGAQPVVPGNPALTGLLADYAERYAKGLRSPDTARFHALRIGRWVEGRRASETRQVVAAIVTDLRGHYAAGTINRSLSTLRRALALAWQRGETQTDYSSLVKLLPEHNARTTTLTLEQVRTLADCASEQVRVAIWLAVLTGCRRGEILALQREDIGEDVIRVKAGNTKTLRYREIPIVPAARPWLAHIPLQINFEGLKSGFQRARVKAGMPEVNFHDLRRSTGTLLLQSGAPMHVVSQLLGHSSVRVTESRYAFLDPGQRAEAMLKAFG